MMEIPMKVGIRRASLTGDKPEHGCGRVRAAPMTAPPRFVERLFGDVDAVEAMDAERLLDEAGDVLAASA